MNFRNHHNALPHEQVRNTHETLADALNNPAYQAYADGMGPLKLDDVEIDARMSDEFETVLDHFGWPSETDAVIEPVAHFHDKDSFLEAFAANGRDLVHLNNFVSWISQKPTFDSIDPSAPMEQIYGRAPALHRLHAVAPDLADSVQTLVADIRARTRTHTLEMKQELALPANENLVKAVHLAYRIVGRLFTVHDKRLQAAVLLPGNDHFTSPDVTSAYEELVA